MQSVQANAYRRRGLSVLAVGLAEPDLGNPLDVDCRHASMQRLGVQVAIHEAWEEDERIALLRLHLKVHTPASHQFDSVPRPNVSGSASETAHIRVG